MFVSEKYSGKCPVSFEIFPPKGEFDIDGVRTLINDLKVLSPDFISVTYSAGGGGNSKKTIDIASIIKNEFGIDAVCHMTCINSDKNEVQSVIDSIKANGIENVLALRGDIVEGKTPTDFLFAKELIPLIKENGLCAGAACYPEGHVDCFDEELDVEYMKEKQDAGAEFFLSQLFFDIPSYYRFMERCARHGINKPISAGIMPMRTKEQIMRFIFMCGASLPRGIINLLNKYENDAESLKAAGVEYASQQIVDLMKNGAQGIHIYTMNRPEIAAENLRRIKNEGLR